MTTCRLITWLICPTGCPYYQFVIRASAPVQSLLDPMTTNERAGIRPEYWALLNDEPYPANCNPLWRMVWIFRGNRLWFAHREEVLSAWIVRRPGTRPSSWWQWEMPLVQRNQVGGHGAFRQMALWCGVPRYWFRSGFSYTDPPIFESQATFLKGQKLLLPEEEAQMSSISFLPEILPKEWWPTDDDWTVN